MIFKFKRTTPDYREAHELFATYKQSNTTYCIYDYETKMYTLEVHIPYESEAQLNRCILQQMFHNYDVCEEEKQALSYADSAIKTLMDMGVLE